jgi:Leucine-rich repeat (LRR) protein
MSAVSTPVKPVAPRTALDLSGAINAEEKLALCPEPEFIKTLNLSGSDIRFLDVVANRFPNLEVLNLSNVGLQPQDLLTLPKTLVTLVAVCTQELPYDRAAPWLEVPLLPNLKVLDLSGYDIADDDTTLCQLGSLEVFCAREVTSLQKFPASLRHLSLNMQHYTYRFMSQLPPGVELIQGPRLDD